MDVHGWPTFFVVWLVPVLLAGFCGAAVGTTLKLSRDRSTTTRFVLVAVMGFLALVGAVVSVLLLAVLSSSVFADDFGWVPLLIVMLGVGIGVAMQAYGSKKDFNLFRR